MVLQAQLAHKRNAKENDRPATAEMTSLPLGQHGSRPDGYGIREKLFGDTIYSDVNYGIRKHHPDLWPHNWADTTGAQAQPSTFDEF